MTRLLFPFLCLALLPSCATTMEVKQQKYTTFKQIRTFENSLSAVWRGVEKALSEQPIVSREPHDVAPQELESLSERQIKTDWIYDKSRDKYVEYKINGFPRKQYLKVRFRYDVVLKKVTGGTEVSVGFEEEVEELDADGNPKGYYSVSKVDTSRANDLLKKIHLSVLAN